MKFLRDNGLSLALFTLFAICQGGLSIVGHQQYNLERQNHEEESVNYLDYLGSGAFLETTMENWESEFLQMFAYVLMTAFLYQRGSAESRNPDKPEEMDTIDQIKPDSPWPVRKGGIILRIYENSLCIVLFLMFAISFALHAAGGVIVYNEQVLAHGGTPITTWEYLGSIQFWFESLQNWQSEFFSIGLIVVLSIFLRQRNSPESKEVAAPHHQTGQ